MAIQHTISDFRDELLDFADMVELQGGDVFREATQTTAEAIAIGNEFGPGAPLDTGFLRSSFRVGVDAIEPGPSEPPEVPKGRKDGDPPIITDLPDLSPIATLQLGDKVYITTMAEYAEHLEEGAMVRRNGPPENIGAPTPFIAPVEQRFPQIVEDAADRVWYP